MQNKACEHFEYIFIAPPQYKGWWEKALRLVDENIALLADDGWVIIQIHPVEEKPLELHALEYLINALMEVRCCYSISVNQEIR